MQSKKSRAVLPFLHIQKASGGTPNNCAVNARAGGLSASILRKGLNVLVPPMNAGLGINILVLLVQLLLASWCVGYSQHVLVVPLRGWCFLLLDWYTLRLGRRSGRYRERYCARCGKDG